MGFVKETSGSGPWAADLGMLWGTEELGSAQDWSALSHRAQQCQEGEAGVGRGHLPTLHPPEQRSDLPSAELPAGDR